MSATFPIPHCTVLFPNGVTFETTHVDHLYNLHLELYHAYPRLAIGEFRLELVEENEEEERAVFQLVMDTYHLQTDVLLEETGDLWVFEIMFSWWLREQEEDGAYDSWAVFVAMDPSNPTSYGLLDETQTDVLTWHSSLRALLDDCPYGIYSEETIQGIEKEIKGLIEEIRGA